MKNICSSFLIAKFGGTSIANFESMKNVVNIIVSHPTIRLIILSASANITDILLSLSEENKISKQKYYLNKIKIMQDKIIDKLQSKYMISKKINRIIKKIEYLTKIKNKKNSLEFKDKLISYGEIISTKIFVEILHQNNISASWFDIRRIMITNSEFGCAKPNFLILNKRTKSILLPIIQKTLVVTQGFIGIESNGRTTTLGRGGSDYTATILGEALRVKRVDIWTDVSGIYTTDPKIVPKAKIIKKISFLEVFQMAKFGAKVIHPSAILPAARQSIPISVKSSLNPQFKGTIICNKIKNKPLFRSLVAKTNQILIILYNVKFINSYIFMIKTISVLMKYKYNIEFFTISNFNITLIIGDNLINKYDEVYLSKLKIEFSSFCKIETRKDLALISLIGNKLKKICLLINKILKILYYYKINVFKYKINNNVFCIVVLQSKLEQTIKILHKMIFMT